MELSCPLRWVPIALLIVLLAHGIIFFELAKKAIPPLADFITAPVTALILIAWVLLVPRRFWIDGGSLVVARLFSKQDYPLLAVQGVYLKTMPALISMVVCFSDRNPVSIPLWYAFPGSKDDDRFRLAAHFSRLASRNSFQESENLLGGTVCIEPRHGSSRFALMYLLVPAVFFIVLFVLPGLGIIPPLFEPFMEMLIVISAVFMLGFLIAFIIKNTDETMRCLNGCLISVFAFYFFVTLAASVEESMPENAGEMQKSVAGLLITVLFITLFLYNYLRKGVIVSPEGMTVTGGFGRRPGYSNIVSVRIFSEEFHRIPVNPQIIIRPEGIHSPAIRLRPGYTMFFPAMRIFSLLHHRYLTMNITPVGESRRTGTSVNAKSIEARRKLLEIYPEMKKIHATDIRLDEEFHPLARPDGLMDSVTELCAT
jgi:hypothetical protein